MDIADVIRATARRWLHDALDMAETFGCHGALASMQVARNVFTSIVKALVSAGVSTNTLQKYFDEVAGDLESIGIKATFTVGDGDAHDTCTVADKA